MRYRAVALTVLTAVLFSFISVSCMPSRAEGFSPLPELLIFQQENVQKDLGHQRKECRTYPKTSNEAVNTAVRAAVDRMADEALTHLPAAGTEVMSWADTGATVTVTGTNTASFLILSHVIHDHDQLYTAFEAVNFNLATGKTIALEDLFTQGAGEMIRAAIICQLNDYFPDIPSDPVKLKTLAGNYPDTPFTLSPAYLIFHYHAQALYPDHNTLMHVWIPYSWLTDWMTPLALTQTDNSRYLLASPTFDDGPSRGVTANVLFILRKHCAAGTFFNNGPQMAKCHDYVKWEHDACHAVQSHTWSHTVGLRNDTQIFNEKKQFEALQVSLIGLRPAYMRSPGGVDNEYIRVGIGMPIIRWNTSTYDAVSDYTLSRSRGVLTSTLTETAVILSHNLAQHSGQNCEQLLSILQQRGYLTVTSDELFRIRQVPLYDNTVYHGDEPGDPGWEQAEAARVLQRAQGILNPTPVPTKTPAPTRIPTPQPTLAPTSTPEPTLIPVGIPVPDLTQEPAPALTLIPIATPKPDIF